MKQILISSSRYYSEPVLSGSETVLNFDINVSPWQAFQISVPGLVCSVEL